MTILTKPIRRETVDELDGSFCRDRGRKLIITLSLGDIIIFRPKGRRARQETISLFDAYRYATRCRVGRETLEKARAKKERKAVRLAALRQSRAEKRLTKG
jgi:hypothetical protein